MKNINFDNLYQPDRKPLAFSISPSQSEFDHKIVAPWAVAYPILNGISKRQCGDPFFVDLGLMSDYLISLAVFILKDGLDSKQMDMFCSLWPQPQSRFDHKRVIFLSTLRYKEGSKLYYSDSQISKKASLANLRDWAVVPSFANGDSERMPLTILELMGINAKSRLEWLSYYLEIQKHLKDDRQWTGKHAHELLGIPNYGECAFLVIDSIVRAHRMEHQAQIMLEECLALHPPE